MIAALVNSSRSAAAARPSAQLLRISGTQARCLGNKGSPKGPNYPNDAEKAKARDTGGHVGARAQQTNTDQGSVSSTSDKRDFQPGLGKTAEQVGEKASPSASPFEGVRGTEKAREN